MKRTLGHRQQISSSERQYSFPISLLSFALILELLFVLVMIVTMVYSEKQVRTTMERQVKLERLQGDILHLDEVLTMSARMSAASGDLEWEERYKLYEPQLEAKISEALRLLPNDGLKGLEETNLANARLVEMELAAFEAVRNGNQKKAKQLLFSPVYEQSKISYALGLRQRLQLLDELVAELIQTQKKQVRIIQVSGFIGWVILIFIWVFVIKNINHWRNLLTKTRLDLESSQDKLEERVQSMARELTHVEHKERERIARLLHDQLQQLLVAARLQINLLPESNEKENIDKLLEDSLQASRTLTIKLSPPVLMQQGIQESIQWLIEWMENNYALKISFDVEGDIPILEREIQIVVFDAIRELLFNVVKHAAVDEAYVYCQCREGHIFFGVQDKGQGFDLERTLSGHRFGLINTLRRIELIGGEINIETAPDQGTHISMVFSLIAESTKDVVRVVLVDDHAIVREGIRTLIEQEKELTVVGEAASLEETLMIVERTNPDVVLMDISLGPDQPDGTIVTKNLRETGYRNTIIALSSYESLHYKKQLQKFGVKDYIIKGEDPKKVINALRKVRFFAK